MALSRSQANGTSHQEPNNSPAPSSKARDPMDLSHSRHDDAGDLSNQTHDLETTPTSQDEAPRDLAPIQTVSITGPLHSVFGRHWKLFIVFMAKLTGFFSPVSASIYSPALSSLARDLHVPNTLINLILTSYMVDFFLLHACGYSAEDIVRYSKVLLLHSLETLQMWRAVDQLTAYALSSTLRPTLDLPFRIASQYCSCYVVSKALEVVVLSPCQVG